MMCAATCISMASTGVPATADELVLLDSFDFDIPGQPPGPPLTGARDLPLGSHTVAGSSANPYLQSMDSNGALIVEWTPTALPTASAVTYSFSIESHAATGPLVARQSLNFDTPSGVRAMLIDWRSNGEVAVAGDTWVVVSSWVPQMSYSINVQSDCSSGAFSVDIDFQPVFSSTLPFPCTNLRGLTSSNENSGTTVQTFDDVGIVAFSPLFADGFESGDLTAWQPASAPAGNTCGTALPFSGGATTIGDLTGKTASGVTDSCGNGMVDLWYEWVAPCTGGVLVTTCHPGTEFDTILSAWNDCPATLELDCNDDAVGSPPSCDLNGANRKSVVGSPVDQGHTYYFRVSAFSDSPGANTGIEISASCSSP